VQLLGEDFLRLGRQHAREGRYLPLDLTGVEDEPVDRNERRQAGEQRQQDRVGDAARDEKEVLLRDFAPGAPENVLPAWQNRITRAVVRQRDLFGRWSNRWTVIRTSNAYVFTDPKAAEAGRFPATSENPPGTQNQDLSRYTQLTREPENLRDR
jgi:hypothetical protein